MICIGPLIYGYPLSQHFPFDVPSICLGMLMPYIFIERSSFVLSLYICEIHKYVQTIPREERKFRTYIFDKSIGSWKTIVVYIFCVQILQIVARTTSVQIIQINVSNNACDTICACHNKGDCSQCESFLKN